MKLPVKFLKFSQSVPIGGRETKFLIRNPDGSFTTRGRPMNIEPIESYLDTDLGIVHIFSGKRHIFIPIQGNIEYGEFLDEEIKEEVEPEVLSNLEIDLPRRGRPKKVAVNE